MFQWYREFSRSERRIFMAAFGGYAMDAFDTMIYPLALPTLTVLWGMSNGEAGVIASTSLAASAVGGWLAGVLADRFGRVVILQITIAWFSVFTVLSGFCNSFETLLAARALEGLGFGGEWSVGSVLIAETVSARHRGKAVGMVQSSWAVGWAFAAACYTIAFQLIPEAYAWRVLFWMGGLPALFVFYIRRGVEEPRIFTQSLATRAAPPTREGIWRIFSPELLSTTVFAGALTTGAQGGYYTVMIWLPKYLKQTRDLSILDTGGYLAVVIAGSFCGYLAGAYLCDLIGRKRKFMLFAVGAGVTAGVYTMAPVGGAAILILGFPLGFFSSGIFSGMGSFLAELYPTAVRGSAQGFTYNFGRGVGALFPALAGRLSDLFGLALSICVLTGIAYGLVLGAAQFLPETKGRDLIS